MQIEDAGVLNHEQLSGGYRLLDLHCPGVSAEVRPGQFVHLCIPRLHDAVLRRPFSVYRNDNDGISILYKQVGRGTEAMAFLREGDEVSLIGPLGNGFPLPEDDVFSVCVAGGYGVAPLSFLARCAGTAGALFVGGAGQEDILCEMDFENQGWQTHVATEDGSRGTRGLVTEVLDAWLARPDRPQRIAMYACGPRGMLKAVGERGMSVGCPAWLSLDRRMGCGVGACLACVQKIRGEDGSIEWLRVCRDGPVFEANQVVWGAE